MCQIYFKFLKIQIPWLFPRFIVSDSLETGPRTLHFKRHSVTLLYPKVVRELLK